MNLHNDTETLKAAIQETSDYFEIRDYLIEKDYWITFILSQLASSTFVKSVVFKGGTSLSKAFRLIDRFSEDKVPGFENLFIATLLFLKTQKQNIFRTN